jgi:predicted amidohydrolase
MKLDSAGQPSGITRRQAARSTSGALASFAALAALPSIAGETAEAAGAAPRSSTQPRESDKAESAGTRLRVATCQFPVSANAAGNARYIRDFMRQASAQGAHLLHTSEASLSGYAGIDFPSLAGFDWAALRAETAALRTLSRDLKMWLVLGSTHFLDTNTKPTNCLYLIDPDGRIVDRYDKCFCTEGDRKFYSAGNRLVTHEIRGVKIGLAICYDVCWPQLYMAYRELGAAVMIHSMHNARSRGANCLDTLNVREVPTRCADNRMWAVVNNSSQPYSHWGAFVARPDATIAKQLEKNQPGMLIHDFPDTLSADGWYHNFKPMKLRDDEIMTWGTPSGHPRQRDGRSEP